MALTARNNGISRRSWLLAGLALPLSRLRAAESLAVSFDGDNLHVAAPGLHFLTGKPLERLKNADTVVYLAQLTLAADPAWSTILKRDRERLIVSFALWDERFAVSIPGAPLRRQSNLTAGQAETWCLENMAVSTLGLPPDRPFWLRFELQTAAQKDLSSLVGESGLSISGFMIDMLSRKRRGPDDLYWTRSAGPLRLADRPRISGRGTRG